MLYGPPLGDVEMIAGYIGSRTLRDRAWRDSSRFRAVAAFVGRMGRANILFCALLLLSLVAAGGVLAHASAPRLDAPGRLAVEPASGEEHTDADCCQPASFHGNCVQSGTSGLPAVEPKLTPRDCFAVVFPRRPDQPHEGRALAPDPAPPRPASA
jgi:hypothetical protein